MRVQQGAIMAAGRATRMFGNVAGSKALYKVRGKALIDYSIESFIDVGVIRLIVLVRPDDSSLREHLAERWSDTLDLEIIDRSPLGTLDAVRTIAASSDENTIVSTCDVVPEPGAIGALVAGATTDAILTLALTTVNVDASPIFVDVDNEIAPTIATSLRKGPPVSRHIFGHVRVASVGLRDVLRDHRFDGLERDTLFMSRLIETHPGSVRVVPCGEMIDVDAHSDRHAAELLIDKWQR